MTTSYLLLLPQMPAAPFQSYSHPADSLVSHFTVKIESIVTELPQAPVNAPVCAIFCCHELVPSPVNPLTENLLTICYLQFFPSHSR